MVKIQLEEMIVKRNPTLKRLLKIAGRKDRPEEFVHRGLMFSLYGAAAGALVAFFLLSTSLTPLVALAAFPILFLLSLAYYLNMPLGWIRMRQRELEKDVLFAGRYLLVKLESGTPLFNALIDASRSYGVSAQYFKEIVDEINTGTPIETALENAREFSASPKFKRLLWQFVSTIETGTDVADALKETLDAITAEQMIDIKEYGKKLNSLLMFYLIIACILPSIGVAMFTIIASFLQLEISGGTLFAILFFLAAVQVMFISLIKSMRPMVNL